MEFRLDFDGVPIILRPAGADDHPFIVDSWVMSHRNQARARDAGRAYLRGHKRAIRECLKRAAVRVACLEERPEVICGWACLEGRTLHYSVTKEPFRNHGIAKALICDLLDGERVTYTHKSWAPVAWPNWVYDPYAFHHGPDPRDEV